MTADELKAWRMHAGLLQREAAAMLGVAEITYRTWESGRYPIRATAIKLIAELNKTHA